MKLYIRKQNYPDHWGERPTSYAIWLKRSWWRRREFLGYSWSFGRAYQATWLIKETYGN